MKLSLIVNEGEVSTFASLCGLLIMVLLGCLAAFPKQNMVRQLQQITKADQVSQDYLRMLVKSYPNYEFYCLQYANQLYLANNYYSAKINLRPILLLPDNKEFYSRAIWLEYLIDKQWAFSLTLDANQKIQAKNIVIKKLGKLTKINLPATDYLQLTVDSMALNDQKLANQFLEKSYQKRKELTLSQLNTAATYGLWMQSYSLAADFYFFAQENSSDYVNKKKYFLLALTTLQSGNLLSNALEGAEKNMNTLANDQEVLTYLTKLAMAANRPDLAEFYINKALTVNAVQKKQ